MREWSLYKMLYDMQGPSHSNMTYYCKTQKKIINNLSNVLILIKLYFSLLDFVCYIFENASFFSGLVKIFVNLSYVLKNCSLNVLFEDSIGDQLTGLNSLYLQGFWWGREMEEGVGMKILGINLSNIVVVSRKYITSF